jgi:hypothetical protein
MGPELIAMMWRAECFAGHGPQMESLIAKFVAEVSALNTLPLDRSRLRLSRCPPASPMHISAQTAFAQVPQSSMQAAVEGRVRFCRSALERGVCPCTCICTRIVECLNARRKGVIRSPSGYERKGAAPLAFPRACPSIPSRPAPGDSKWEGLRAALLR